jgi:thiol-disulfide isomerase/thioredoxin
MHKALLFLCILSSHLIAQKAPTTQTVVRTMNQRIREMPHARYELTFRHKSMLDADTLNYQGTVYFSRAHTAQDSVGQFLLYVDGLLHTCYDGKDLCYIHHKNQMVFETSPVTDVKAALSGNMAREQLVFMPFVANRKEAFRLEKYRQYKLSKEIWQGQPCYLLEKTDSFSIAEADKIEPTDPEMGAIITKIWVHQSNYRLVSLRQWVYQTRTPQYQSYDFSPLQAITAPFRVAVHDTVQHYLAQGYQLYTEAPEPDSLEPAGPEATWYLENADCPVQDLYNNTFRLSELKGDLLLFDFWYRSCYPCAKAVPTLRKLHENFAAKGLRIYAINPYDKDVEQLKTYQKEKNIPYDILLMSSGACPEKAGALAYPAFVLWDKKRSEILFYQSGFTEDTYEQIRLALEGRL